MARLVGLSLVILFLILEVVIANDNPKTLRDEMEFSTFKRRYDICHLPLQRGHCSHGVKSWYFDHKIKGCLRFTYTLCGGNANRFYSEKECMEFCGDYGNTYKMRALEDPVFDEEGRVFLQ